LFCQPRENAPPKAFGRSESLLFQKGHLPEAATVICVLLYCLLPNNLLQ